MASAFSLKRRPRWAEICTQLALAYKELKDIDALVVTGEHEQYDGCFKLLQDNGIKNKIIGGFDVHHDLFRLTKEFVKIVNTYNPHIVTVNTNWQLLVVGLANLFSKRRYKIIYTVHGFRHNSRLKSVFGRYLIGLVLFTLTDTISAPTTYVRDNFKLLNYKVITIPLGNI